MLRTTAARLAASAAIAVVALTACGGGTDTASSTAPAPSAQQAAEATTIGGDAGVSMLSGTARSNKADEKVGDLAPADAPQAVRGQWVQLRAAQAGALNPVVVNGAGLTLYRFDNDTAKPSKSNCNGQCATTWPPVTVNKGGRVFVSGIKGSDVGFVKRDDGQFQLTVRGWPVYRFNKDTKAGETLGQGVGGTWFGVTPTGEKAGAGAAVEPPPAAAPGAKPSTAVTLFSGKDFDDFSGNNFATRIQGPGCQDVRGAFLSINPGGSVKLWAEAGCKGASATISDDVRDLSTLGFPNGPRSIQFG